MGKPWIKLAYDTPDKPELETVAIELGVTPNEVLGALCRVWIWFSDQTLHGRYECPGAPRDALALVDRKGMLPGLGAALVGTGWLQADGSALAIANFDRWIGSAKDARRKREERDGVLDQSRTSPGQGSDQSGTRPAPQRTENREQSAEDQIADRNDQNSENKEGRKGSGRAPRWDRDLADRLKGFDHPDRVSAAIRDWAHMRRQRKSPLTHEAAGRAIRKLSKLSCDHPETAVDILNRSTDKGWTDLYPLTDDRNGRAQGKHAWRNEVEIVPDREFPTEAQP